MRLAAGLYEALITRDRAGAIRALEELLSETEGLSVEAAPHVLARHLSELLVKALRHAPGNDKLEAQVSLANRLVALLADATPEAGIDETDAIESPASMLLSLREAAADRLGSGKVVRPTSGSSGSLSARWPPSSSGRSKVAAS